MLRHATIEIGGQVARADGVEALKQQRFGHRALAGTSAHRTLVFSL